jgi:trimeric autotransporter adhesin
MRHAHPLPRLLALLALAACGEDQAPTAPTPPAGPGGPAYSHISGHEVVNSLADPGNGICNATQCTLREAITDPLSTEISFAPGLTGTITLASLEAGGGPLRIDKNLSITGPSAGIVIQRRSTDSPFRIVRIGAGVSVKLTNLTLRNGKTGRVDLTGGGLINFGTLELTNCTVAGNSATLGGGGIDNWGQLTLTHATVANDSTAHWGGGILNSHGTLTVTNSLVTGNSAGFGGGGIANFEGHTLTLANSLVTGNSTTFGGGGIANLSGTATLTNTRIVDNSASSGGGISSGAGTFTLTTSTVARNVARAGRGGGIASAGKFTIIKSTIAGNSASGEGGGIANLAGHRFMLTNSTVSGNSAVEGGGIFAEGGEFTRVFAITNSTVARNRATQAGGGILQSSLSLLALRNSLVAQNSAPTGADVNNTSGNPTGARFSLIGDGSGSGITNTNGNQVGTASAPIDPKLGSLADNGGPTRTHALLLGSPAIDAASTPDCPTTDQRGVLRPQGAACDIGSYERK